MTTARSAGFYWIRTFGVWNYEKPAFDRLAYVAPVIAEWTGARWCISGYSAGVDLDVLDADVLAGPLQAPTDTSSRAERLASLDAEFVAATTRPDGSVGFRWANGPGTDRPDATMPDPQKNAAEVARYIDVATGKLHDLRLRARALLEGTTPGPWSDAGWETIEACNGATVAECYLSADTRLVLGAHALLIELAKEPSDVG